MRVENAESVPPAQIVETVLPTPDDPTHAAPKGAATAGEHKDDSKLLTIRDVAELLRVPVSWVYNHTRRASRDRIPGIRLGKYWRFNEADVRTWLREKTQK